MAILIDSDVIIQAERGLFDLDAWLVSLPREEFKLAVITLAELWHGVERATGPHRTKRHLFLQRIFATFEFVPYGEQAAFEHGKRPKLPSGVVTASVADLCARNEVSTCFQVDTSSIGV
jgi:predicted nucleic acid-binding protein